MFQQLARYIYEFQYLRFSEIADRRSYFIRSTWFAEQFLLSGAIREELFDRLLTTMGLVCDAYEVDESMVNSVERYPNRASSSLRPLMPSAAEMR